MRKLLFINLLLLCTFAEGRDYNINQLQGSWWLDETDPVAAFEIKGNTMFGDSEDRAHCKIKGNILYIDYGSTSGVGVIKKRIVRLSEKTLVLQEVAPPYEKVIYFRIDAPKMHLTHPSSGTLR